MLMIVQYSIWNYRLKIVVADYHLVLDLTCVYPTLLRQCFTVLL
jgi:hypothetical protein